MPSWFVEFEVNEDGLERFQRLNHIFEEIKKDKVAGKFRDIIEWIALFGDRGKSAFWWPAKEELKAWETKWFSTPVHLRWSDPSLKQPWTLDSLIYAFETGEYELKSCRMIGKDRARLEFDPYAHPYGGMECFEGLIESFGFKVLQSCDGTEQ